jgi:hypothetical protein
MVTDFRPRSVPAVDRFTDMHNGAIMPTDVRYLVVTGEPYALLRLQGVLDSSTAGALRGPLLSFAADQAPPLVIDVGGLRVDDPAAMVAFADVARETADWPSGMPVINVGDSLAGEWAHAGLQVVHDPAAIAKGPGPDEVLALELDPVTGAARRARELVTEGCARWDLVGAAGAVCIVVTELVNNVVAHAHTPMTVKIGLGLGDDAVHLAVRDRSTTLPALGGPVPTTAYGGRGLLLVESVANRWGSTALPDGKVVWAVVDPDET